MILYLNSFKLTFNIKRYWLSMTLMFSFLVYEMFWKLFNDMLFSLWWRSYNSFWQCLELVQKQIWIRIHRKVGPIVRWERTCHQHLKRCWKMHFCHRYILTSVLFTHQQPQQSCSGSFLGNLQNVLQSSLPKLSTSLDMEVTLEFDC